MTRVERAPGGAWVLAGVAVGLAAALALGATLVTPVPMVVALVAWTGAMLVAVAAAAGRPAVVGWGIALVTGAWAVCVAVEPDGGTGRLDAAPIVVAPALLLAAELAYWSLEPGVRTPGATLRGPAVARRVGDLVALALTSAAAATVVLGVAGAASGRGLGLEAVGVTAVLVLLAAIVALAGRWSPVPG